MSKDKVKRKNNKLNLCLTLSQLLGTIGLPNKNSAWNFSFFFFFFAWNFSTFLTDVGCTFDRAGNCHSKHAYRGVARKSNNSDCFKSVIFLNDLMQWVSEEFRQF